MKTANFTSAIKKAARGNLSHQEPSNRSVKVYGFKDRALKMSSEEIRVAWKSASSSRRKIKA